MFAMDIAKYNPTGSSDGKIIGYLEMPCVPRIDDLISGCGWENYNLDTIWKVRRIRYNINDGGHENVNIVVELSLV